nr:exodeoxyribonuclease VII large subunit [Rhizobium sp. CFBP 8762]
MSLFDTDTASNLVEYSVSELSGSIKRTVEQAFDQVRVRGEISGYRGPHSSGHAYFSLKDDRARIEAVIWKTTMARLKFRPEEGMEVIATGKITTFPGSSKYQIVIESLEPAGAGALMALLEERKRKFAAEGLFEQSVKKALPFMPSVIGVVTSPTGAVIRDILHRISDRFPVHVIVWPVRVQGDGAGNEVAAAITGFNSLTHDGPLPRPDVLIVARGGGSLEDLWCFNDEAVVRAAAGSVIPLISAVGHETDWTLIDYAADRRAPTPTGAAEMAVPVKADLEAQLSALTARLKAAVNRRMSDHAQEVRALARALPSLDQLLALPRRRFDDVATGLARGLQMNTVNKRRTLEQMAGRLRPDMLVNRLTDRRQKLTENALRRERAVERMLARHRHAITGADAALRALPARLSGQVHRAQDRVAGLGRRTDSAILNDVRAKKASYLSHGRMLDSLSYKNVLSRGYALVRDADGHPVKAAAELIAATLVIIEFADGQVGALTSDTLTAQPAAVTSAKKRGAKGTGRADVLKKQGSLF